jgi:AcrR family transcriptional regulator
MPRKRKSAQRKRLPPEERKKTIIKAAERCLARKGYYSATTAEIAAEAGITEPVLYQHFKGKSDIVEQMRRTILREVAEYTAKRFLREDTPLKGLRAAAEAALDFTSRHRNKLRAQYYSIPELHGGGMRASSKERLHILHDVVTAVIKEAQKRGEARKDIVPSDFAWSYISLLDIIFIANALDVDIISRNKQKYMELVDRLLALVSARGDGSQ